MLKQLLVALGLMAICVVIHAAGMAHLLRRVRREASVSPQVWQVCGLLIRMASLIVGLHLVEITVWALAYAWRGAMDDLQSALYFSAVTYTTTGYGDVVLPANWRLVGAVEALTGILMCGWSTGFFFAIVSRTFAADATTPSSLGR
jgi:hypothetical protein